MSRLLAALCAVPLALALAAPAAAYDLGVDVPHRVVVNQSYEEIPWRLTGQTRFIEEADLNLEHRYTRDLVDFDYGMSGVFKIYDWERMGTHVVKGSAYDYDYNEYAVDTATVVIKRASRTSLSATRSGRTVSFRATSRKYVDSYDGYQPHVNATVVIQRRTASGGWKNLATRTVPRNGVVTAMSTQSRGTFRAVTREASVVWESATGVLTR